MSHVSVSFCSVRNLSVPPFRCKTCSLAPSGLRMRDPVPISAADKAHGQQFLGMMEWHDRPEDTDGTRKRRAARVRCARLINWTVGNQLVHPCPPACCTSQAEARAKVWEPLGECFFSRKPQVPAKNQCTKLFPAFCWWLMVLSIPGVPLLVLLGATRPEDMPQRDVQITVGQVIGAANGDLQMQAKFARFKKLSAWAKNPRSRLRLLCAVVLFRPLDALMTALFQKSVWGFVQTDVFDFTHPSTNPGVPIVHSYFAMM